MVAHAPPQSRTERESDQHVEHGAGLLGVELVEIDEAGIGNRGLESSLCDLVECDTGRRCRIKTEGLTGVPGDGLALTIIV